MAILGERTSLTVDPKRFHDAVGPAAWEAMAVSVTAARKLLGAEDLAAISETTPTPVLRVERLPGGARPSKESGERTVSRLTTSGRLAQDARTEALVARAAVYLRLGGARTPAPAGEVPMSPRQGSKRRRPRFWTEEEAFEEEVRQLEGRAGTTNGL